MLSRVAERVYWMARYIERAEDTARLIAAYNHLIMDVPNGTQPEWEVLIRILDADPLFDERFRVRNEQNVLRLLISEHGALCSIPYAVRHARENARTTRDVLPDEVWELINEMHLFVHEHAEGSVGRRNRQGFLEEVIRRAQVINGVLRSTLCRDHSYRFIKIGQLLERADMTTRIIDVGARDFRDKENAQHAIEHLLWGTLLRSLSALGAYRRNVSPQVEKNAAVDFVFMEATFPRSVRFCVREIRAEFGQLVNNRRALRAIDRLRRQLRDFHSEAFTAPELHGYIDDLQLKINDLHASISDTWFLGDA